MKISKSLRKKRHNQKPNSKNKKSFCLFGINAQKITYFSISKNTKITPF